MEHPMSMAPVNSRGYAWLCFKLPLLTLSKTSCQSDFWTALQTALKSLNPPLHHLTSRLLRCDLFCTSRFFKLPVFLSHPIHRPLLSTICMLECIPWIFYSISTSFSLLNLFLFLHGLKRLHCKTWVFPDHRYFRRRCCLVLLFFL